VEVIIQPTREEAGRVAAAIVARLVREKPDAVLGLATGSTPLGLYRELARMHHDEGLDFSAITTFNLDEYVGLAPDHPASYHTFMRKNLFDQINITEERIHIPNGSAQDIPAHCLAYEEAIIEAGGIDLQVLGIGSDGHIGFNEPTSSLASRTRIKTLTQATIDDNARFFANREDVPVHVITMGIGTIMDAGQCVVLAYGEAKAQAVAGMVEGPLTAIVPASILQMHPLVKVLLDEPAASALQKADYYRRVHDMKPEWQRE
jgi:glucosamine-6-phosphate deaminase